MTEVTEIERVFSEALRLKSASAVWAHLAQLRPRLGEREIALAWMTLAQASPKERELGSDAVSVLDAHAQDAECVIATITALVRRVDSAGLDAPVEVGPALGRGVTAARTLKNLDPAHRAPLSAALGNAILRLEPESAEGLAELSRAVELDPEGPWLSDLILVHKRARRFRAALVVARNAISRHGPKKPLLTELVIAALGSGEPGEAAEALRTLGLPVEHDGDALPFVAGLPWVAVRAPSRAPEHGLLGLAAAPSGPLEGAFETVWVQPLSPAHGVVRTAAFRESRVDFGDVILFDVAPITMVARPRELGETGASSELAPLLGFLSVLKPGDERRLRFLALEQSVGQVRGVLGELPQGVLPFVHSEHVERVCPRCMAGETLVRHEHLPPEDQRVVIGKLVVPRALSLEDVATGLERARQRAPGVLLAIPQLFEELGRTADAGKHHKTWGAIERGMAKRTGSAPSA